MTPARVLINVTQYASWPATTGIQRTLLHITSHWRGETLEARYGVLRDDAFLVGPLELLAFVLREAFAFPGHDPARHRWPRSCSRVPTQTIRSIDSLSRSTPTSSPSRP